MPLTERLKVTECIDIEISDICYSKMQFCRKISDLLNQFFIYFSFTLKVFELQRPTIYPKIAFYSCLTKNPQKYCNDLLVAMVLPPKLCKMCGLPPNFERIRFLWWNSSSSYEVSNKWNACKQRGSGVYGLCITRTDAFVWCLGTTTSDDVASRLQVSDLYKSDLQVSSQFANDFMWNLIFLFLSMHKISVILLV